MDESLDDLRGQVEELSERIYQVTGHQQWGKELRHGDRLDELERRVGHHSLFELAENLESLRAHVHRVAGGTDDTETSLRELDARLRLVERRLKAVDGIDAADLDRWPAPVQALAESVRAGQQASERLLDDYTTRTLTNRINQPGVLRQQQAENLRSALVAARAAATADIADSNAWQAVRQQWNTAVTGLKALDPQVDEAVKDALHAQKELGAAQEQHNLAVDPYNKGLRARTALTLKVRTRLGEALRDDLLMPTWFDRALGPTAPSRRTEAWLETAVEVIVYRLVHRVDDPVLALGARPADHRRRLDYDDLTQRCANQRS